MTFLTVLPPEVICPLTCINKVVLNLECSTVNAELFIITAVTITYRKQVMTRGESW